MATFEMFFTGVPGGPCPACGGSGELKHHFGTYGPEGIRVINHEGSPEGGLCFYEEADGILWVRDGRWWYEKRERTTMKIYGNCPFGCGQTLFVDDGGYITCSGGECPRPGAVTDLLHDSETEHIIATNNETYNVIHPLRERLDRELLGCEFSRYLDTLEHAPVAEGNWRVSRTHADPGLPGWTWQPA